MASKKTQIRIVLTSGNMGLNATEEDYDSFADFVLRMTGEFCPEADVVVEQYPFGIPGRDKVRVQASDEVWDALQLQRDIEELISYDWWDAWCAGGLEKNGNSVRVFLEAVRKSGGEDLNSSVRRVWREHPRLCEDVLETIGEWPSSEPELRALQRIAR